MATMTTPTAPIAAPRRSEFAAAAKDDGVIWLGLFALGIGFGVLAVSKGLPWWLAPVISASVYAGSVEFILIGMLAAGDPIAAIATTTFLVNSRHLFYGISFPLHRVEGRLRKAYSIFSLTDEAYALLATRDPDTLSSKRIIATQIGLQLSWAGGGFTGALVGSAFLSDIEGLDFILTALFIVLAIDAYRANPDRITLALATASAVIAIVVASGSMVLVAMTLFTALLLVRHRANTHRALTHRSGRSDEDHPQEQPHA